MCIMIADTDDRVESIASWRSSTSCWTLRAPWPNGTSSLSTSKRSLTRSSRRSVSFRGGVSRAWLTEQADQIAALYDLLSFEDKPVPARNNAAAQRHTSVHDVMRMVKESLGEEAFERLNLNGKGRR